MNSGSNKRFKQWIPCEQELPPMGIPVIATVEMPDYPSGTRRELMYPVVLLKHSENPTEDAWLYKGEFIRFEDDYQKILAWTPFPKLWTGTLIENKPPVGEPLIVTIEYIDSGVRELRYPMYVFKDFYNPYGEYSYQGEEPGKMRKYNVLHWDTFPDVYKD